MHTKIETKQPKPRLLFVMVIRWLIIGENKLLNKEHMHFGCNTVNQQILAAIKFGVSQNKVIWRLLNLASPRGRLCSVRSTYILAGKTRNSPNIIAHQN